MASGQPGVTWVLVQIISAASFFSTFHVEDSQFFCPNYLRQGDLPGCRPAGLPEARTDTAMHPQDNMPFIRGEPYLRAEQWPLLLPSVKQSANQSEAKQWS